jgi:ElaB/YqjD/DUF883 family membrane-anchored ribosome-binding protein
MITITNETSNTHAKFLIEEIMEEVTEKLMEKILAMVNQKVKDSCKKFQDITNKVIEKTQKQLNDFNKHQSETKDTIKKEMHKIYFVFMHKI